MQRPSPTDPAIRPGAPSDAPRPAAARLARAAFGMAVACAVVASLALSFAPVPATAQPAGAGQPQACGCADVRDVRNRYCEARAAIDEYSRQLRFIRDAEAKDGKPRMYTVDAYSRHVQPCVQEAINAVTDSGANRTTGDTDNACRVTISPGASTCTASLIEAHEAVHVTVCRRYAQEREDKGFWAELRGTFSAFRDSMTLADMVNEERSAYQVEVNRARDELQRLAGLRCPGLTPPAPGRLATIDPCPPPKPRPKPEDSVCLHR